MWSAINEDIRKVLFRVVLPCLFLFMAGCMESLLQLQFLKAILKKKNLKKKKKGTNEQMSSGEKKKSVPVEKMV